MTELNLKRGIFFAYLTALISGFAVFVNKFSIGLWTDSSGFTAAKNIVAAIFLTGLIIGFKKLPELRKLNISQWTKLGFIAVIGGSVPFLLFFRALTVLPASEAAFIHKTLFIWVAVLAVPFLKERLNFVQLVALGAIFSGVLLFGGPSQWVLGEGFLLALAATVFWAVENIIAKKALKEISSTVVGWARMFLGSVVIVGYLVVTGGIQNIMPASFEAGTLALLVGIVLFAYVITWYEALKHAPATVVTSILVLAAPLTSIFNSLYSAQSIPAVLVLPSVLILSGTLLFSWRALSRNSVASLPANSSV